MAYDEHEPEHRPSAEHGGKVFVWLLDRLGEPAEISSPRFTRDPMDEPAECVVCGSADPQRVLRVERASEDAWWHAFVPKSFGKRLLLPACPRCAARSVRSRVIGMVWFFGAFGVGLLTMILLRGLGLAYPLSLGIATIVAFVLMPWGWVLWDQPVRFERERGMEKLVCHDSGVLERVTRAIGHDQEPPRHE